VQKRHELKNSKLWKFLEIRRKIGKMQIQMFWNPCNKIYNFCYMHIFIFCLYFNL